MIRRIKTAEDVAWLLEHTHAFHGGRVTDLHVQKLRVYDEETGCDITAGTAMTLVVRYDLGFGGHGGASTVSRVAKLTMKGVTDFSVFDQEGADFSDLETVHAESAGGRLRFWFDPEGKLYVICDEAEIEEVSKPGFKPPVRAGMTEWTFQAESGEAPTVQWFLERLDQAGLPCAWRDLKPTSSHPAVRWSGRLVLTGDHGFEREGVQVQVYGPLDGSCFGVTLRAPGLSEGGTRRLLLELADLIARHFPGMCLTRNRVMERDEWLGERTGQPS